MVDSVSEERQKLKFEDTNLANFGTELEYEVKKNAAMHEKEWKGTESELGLKIWRIEKFNVVAWPLDQYGYFYSGDSYIVLHTEKDKSGRMIYNAHMWVGEYTTQDEAGTAAYKVVELDDYLDRKATLFREVQGSECHTFITYFNNRINIMDGGIETGFSKVKKTEYKPKLFHVRRNDSVYRITEVHVCKSKLNVDDCFVLDKGLEIYQYNGEFCSPYEKFKAAAFVQDLKNSRSGVKTFLVEGNNESEGSKQFWEFFGGDKCENHKAKVEKEPHVKKLIMYSDETGEPVKKEIASGKNIKKELLDSKDVFLLDTEEVIFLWIGKEASKNEKRLALSWGHEYLKETGRPIHLTICVVSEGMDLKDFYNEFSA